MTRSAAEAKRDKAAEFLRRIGQDDGADKVEAMDAEEYAEHKGAELRENPHRRGRFMARQKSRSRLQTELDEVNEYIEELKSKLDSIAGIASGEEEEDGVDQSEERRAGLNNPACGRHRIRLGMFPSCASPIPFQNGSP
jgi:hypothetical protein